MRRAIIIICLFFGIVTASTKTDDLLVKGDEFYFKGDLQKALTYYYEAEDSDPGNLGAMTGIYNASINSGGIKAANDYAYKLVKADNSEINQDRVIYSDALLGKTAYAEKMLKSDLQYYRRKIIYSLAGWGLSQTGYYQETADWYKKAIDDGFNSDEFHKAYSAVLPKLKREDDKKHLDVIFSSYSYGGNELLKGGFNLNVNYNFGKSKHRFNTNFVLQDTGVDPAMNEELGFRFYEDIGQYEIFGQYNYVLNPYITPYTGVKGSILVNDYIQGLGSLSAGARFGYSFLRCNTFVNYSSVSYNYYEFTENPLPRDSKYKTFTDSFSSLQYTFDASLTVMGAYAGGIVHVVNDFNSHYAEDMMESDRDSLVTTLSPAILDGGPRYLYGATAGYKNEKYDFFCSWTTGDMFLVNTGEGRYLNTNDSELKQNILAGVIFRELFGDWILGYTFSYSDFRDYTIVTNSIIANYNWR